MDVEIRRKEGGQMANLPFKQYYIVYIDTSLMLMCFSEQWFTQSLGPIPFSDYTSTYTEGGDGSSHMKLLMKQAIPLYPLAAVTHLETVKLKRKSCEQHTC